MINWPILVQFFVQFFVHDAFSQFHLFFIQNEFVGSYKLLFVRRHESVLVNLKSKADWFFERNPSGLVPIIEHKGSIIFESAICNEFLEEAYPGSSTGTRDLLPSSCPYKRAAVRLFIDKYNQV